MKYQMPLLCSLAFSLLIAELPVQAQSPTFTVLYSFSSIGSNLTNDDGADSQSGLILSGNTFYGTAYQGGVSANGTVFRIDPNGSTFTFSNLHSFTATNVPNLTNNDGANPIAGLILSSGTLYGTTQNGGAGGSGTVFSLNTDNSYFSNLYSFTANSAGSNYTNGDGANPASALVLSGNTLFGTAQNGGAGGSGTVYRVNIDGSGFTNLHSFTINSGAPDYTNNDGAYPAGSLMLTGQTLYGMAQRGGPMGNGAVFRVDTDGSGFTNLHSFTFTSSVSPYTNSDGAVPLGNLILSADKLYGTTPLGGVGGGGVIFSINTDGSDFTNLYNFTATNGPNSTNFDGSQPIAGLLLLNHTLYGAAGLGGTGGTGTIFCLNTNGSNFVNLYNFTSTSASSYTNNDGAVPLGNLILSDDTLYGTTAKGGGSGAGTVFALGLPIPPLSIAFMTGQGVISWPAWGSNFALQATTRLYSGNWSNITDGPAIIGTNYVFTNILDEQAGYFRLQQK
jgi:uncharacterized repeat protein (TIGR03803 family)